MRWTPGDRSNVEDDRGRSGMRLAGGVPLGPTPDQADFPAMPKTSAMVVSSSGGNSMQQPVGEVSVQSSVTMDTQQSQDPRGAAQIQSLLSKLSTTTSQVDEYSRRADEQISSEANKRIQQIISNTPLQQDNLMRDASSRSLEIEAEYSTKLKAFLQELDASKASNLASLEKDLNYRQEQLLSEARDEMDRIYQDSTQQKMAIMQRANSSMLHDVDSLTTEMKRLGTEEVERRLNSTTTTVIKTQTTAESASPRTHLDTTVKTAHHEETINKLQQHNTATDSKHVAHMSTMEPRTSTITRI